MRHHFVHRPGNARPFICSICTYSLRTLPQDVGGCPGVRWYAWRTSPDHLKTYSQLRAAHLRPADRRKPDGCIVVKENWCWLYDERQALRRRQCSPLQLQALEIARQRQQDKWRCQHCHYAPANPTEIKYYFLAPGTCKGCAERIEEEMRLYSDRKDAIEWAQAMLARTDWALIDTETTALDGVAVEIAAIAPDGTVLFHSLVKPAAGYSMTAGARQVHGISDEELAVAPELAEIWSNLQTALAGRELLAYNADFDCGILQRSARSAKLAELPGQWACVMNMYAAFYGDWSDYWGSYRWQQLPGAGHRALGDARAALDLMCSMAAADLEDEC